MAMWRRRQRCDVVAVRGTLPLTLGLTTAHYPWMLGAGVVLSAVGGALGVFVGVKGYLDLQSLNDFLGSLGNSASTSTWAYILDACLGAAAFIQGFTALSRKRTVGALL